MHHFISRLYIVYVNVCLQYSFLMSNIYIYHFDLWLLKYITFDSAFTIYDNYLQVFGIFHQITVRAMTPLYIVLLGCMNYFPLKYYSLLPFLTLCLNFLRGICFIFIKNSSKSFYTDAFVHKNIYVWFRGFATCFLSR